jgi:hypothetical protein
MGHLLLLILLLLPLSPLPQEYCINKEQYDWLGEVTKFKTQGLWGADPLKEVPAKTKAAFTRAFNSQVGDSQGGSSGTCCGLYGWLGALGVGSRFGGRKGGGGRGGPSHLSCGLAAGA